MTYALFDAPAAFEAHGPYPLDASPPVELHLLAPLNHASPAPRVHAVAPLVGRSGERALLRALAERAPAGTRSAVLLRGQAGIGKTRLAMR